MIQAQFHTRIKVIQYDNGLEFSMPDTYASQCIIHHKSCIETPQQNGVGERKHQHILNVARALRFQAQLPLTFCLFVFLLLFT